jgi:hypothetical protein
MIFFLSFSDSATAFDRAYIFISIPLASSDGYVDSNSTSSLLSAYIQPEFVDPSFVVEAEKTDLERMTPNLQTRKIQFYLGPKFTGAPLHFHRAAYNG